jgi:NRPS condensation-like uncharacterized protein
VLLLAAGHDPLTARLHHTISGGRGVNTIALSCATTYHKYMTTWQTPIRAGYSNPISQLDAALIGGVVAV